MDLQVTAIVGAAFLAGGLVKGVVGMGLPTVALAVLGSAFGLHEALPLLVVPTFGTNVWQALFGRHLRALLRRFWPVLAGSIAGVVPGTWILFAFSATTMNAALGTVLCVYAGFGLARLRLAIPPGAEPRLGPAVGLGAGVIAGATGSLVGVGPYFEALKLEKEAFIQAMGLSFAISSAALGVALAGQKAFDPQAFLLSSAALAPAFLGMYAGQLVRSRLSPDAFRRWVFIALLALGAHMIARAAF
jgi:uncharacterized membrane protein YfcA